MTALPFHDVANIFPLLDGNEFTALAESIKTRGLCQQIILFEGKILDGRNRYRACIEASVEPRFTEFEGCYEDAVESVWDWNLKRRHLNSTQAACADVLRDKKTHDRDGLREEAKAREAKGRPVQPLREEGPELIPEGNGETRDTRAEEAGTNGRYISLAEMLYEKYPVKFSECWNGLKTLTQAAREIKKEELAAKTTVPLSVKYRVIYADPPWKYADQLAISKDGTGESYGPADAHYPQMSIADLCLLPVADIAEDNAVLFLWTTSPLLEDAFQIINAWGFEYKAAFIWDKIKHNMGHYNSVRHELLLIGTRGSCLPDVSKLFDSVLSIERSEKHSEKPQEFRDIIDTLYPAGARIELFARAPHENWETWGNEAGGTP